MTSAVAFTAFTNAWPRAIETEIDATLCATGRVKDFDFFLNKNIGQYLIMS